MCMLMLQEPVATHIAHFSTMVAVTTVMVNGSLLAVGMPPADSVEDLRGIVGATGLDLTRDAN